MGRVVRLHYQVQDSSQTLAEALAEYYAGNVGVVSRPADLPPESKTLFRNHDICHVIFGLDTTLEDEAMADTRTLLSCDVGFMHYVKYLQNDEQAKAIFKSMGYGTIIWGTLKSVPRILRAVAETFHIKKKWPWNAPEGFAQRPLSEIRQEFGIRVI